MRIHGVPASYGVDVEATLFPFFGRKYEGMLVIPTVVLALVENMVKKNRNYFPIAVLLTTMICNH
jgi:hypothetical protein